MWTILDGIIDELDYVRLVITEWIDALDDDITRSTPRNMHKQHLHDASVVLQDFVNVVKPLLSDMREFENDASALSVFCGENSEIFKKSYDELERIFADIEALMAKRKSLEEYFASSQAERLTKVLYVCSSRDPALEENSDSEYDFQVHFDLGHNNVCASTVFDRLVGYEFL